MRDWEKAGDPIALAIGAKLRELRTARGWTQAHVSALTGILRPIVARNELGPHALRLDTIARYARVYGVRLSEIVAAADEQTIEDLRACACGGDEGGGES